VIFIATLTVILFIYIESIESMDVYIADKAKQVIAFCWQLHDTEVHSIIWSTSLKLFHPGFIWDPVKKQYKDSNMLHYDIVVTYIFRGTGRRWGNLYLWGREVRSFGMCLINVEIEEVPWIFLQHVRETSTGLGSYKYILRSKSLCILCMKRYN
jgi:hypothetical protein